MNAVMLKPTIRYMLVATAVISICLTIIELPSPPAIVIHVNSNKLPKYPPFQLWHLITSWRVRTLAYTCGIGMFMHMLTGPGDCVRILRWGGAR